MADFTFVSPISIEDWCWENAETGIGGNEQGVAEFSWRLARRGHSVAVYTRTPWKDGPRLWRGTRWDHVAHIDFSRSGVWVLFRCPDLARLFPRERTDQVLWLVVQDFEYDWGAPYFGRIDKILMTCRTHMDILVSEHPELKPKLGVTSNGVKVDLIEELEASRVPERNSRKIMFASSPDRGLRNLIGIFGRARKRVPQLELHAFYGFDGIERIAALSGGWPPMEREKAMITSLARRTSGVFLRGRVTQRELYREWLTSGLFVYPTTFPEMSFITGREAQCCGAVPIFTPVWGQKDNVHHGISIEGDPDEDSVRDKFVEALVKLSTDIPFQEAARQQMMAESRPRCDWERFCSQWESLAIREEAACVAS